MLSSHKGSPLSSESYARQYDLIRNAFRLDKNNEFCLTAMLESPYDFLNLDDSKQYVTIMTQDSHREDDYD